MGKIRVYYLSTVEMLLLLGPTRKVNSASNSKLEQEEVVTVFRIAFAIVMHLNSSIKVPFLALIPPFHDLSCFFQDVKFVTYLHLSFDFRRTMRK